MDRGDGEVFEPATGNELVIAGTEAGHVGGDEASRDTAVEARRASVRTAFEGLLQIRRLTGSGGAGGERTPAAWELARPVRAVALALEASGAPPSALDAEGRRTRLGYAVSEDAGTGAVRVKWLGPPGSGAADGEEMALNGCADTLRSLGWTVLLYRGERRRRFLEVELGPPARGRGAGR